MISHDAISFAAASSIFARFPFVPHRSSFFSFWFFLLLSFDHLTGEALGEVENRHFHGKIRRGTDMQVELWLWLVASVGHTGGGKNDEDGSFH